MGLIDRLMRKSKDKFFKEEIVFFTEIMDAPKINSDGVYVKVGYIDPDNDKFVDLMNKKCIHIRHLKKAFLILMENKCLRLPTMVK